MAFHIYRLRDPVYELELVGEVVAEGGGDVSFLTGLTGLDRQ